MFGKRISAKKIHSCMKNNTVILITGKSGMGKSYILKSVQRELQGQKGALITGRELCDSIVKSLRTSNRENWEKSLNENSYLLIDDIDCVACMEATQKEFVRLLKLFNKPVVVTAEKEFSGKKFCREFIEFFTSGKRVKLKKPSKIEKDLFLKEMLTDLQIMVTKDARKYILKQDFAGYFSMQGYIKTLQAYAAVNSPITADICKEVKSKMNLK